MSRYLELAARLFWPAEGLVPTPCERILTVALGVVFLLSTLVATGLWLWPREKDTRL
jgi:hypothetical protein